MTAPTCRFCGHFDTDHCNETIGCLGDSIDRPCDCKAFQPKPDEVQK
jgi:hypothetical protein